VATADTEAVLQRRRTVLEKLRGERLSIESDAFVLSTRLAEIEDSLPVDLRDHVINILRK
jgi:hypothetical protein